MMPPLQNATDPADENPANGGTQPETPFAILCASLSAFVMVAYLIFFLWLLADTLTGARRFSTWISQRVDAKTGAGPTSSDNAAPAPQDAVDPPVPEPAVEASQDAGVSPPQDPAAETPQDAAAPLPQEPAAETPQDAAVGNSQASAVSAPPTSAGAAPRSDDAGPQGESHQALTVFYLAFIGGAIGGIVNEMRSLLVWHAERRAYGARFIWKGIMAPWVGGTLALVAVAIISGGVSMVGASFNTGEMPHQVFSVFAIGAMAGYGARDVSKWLDANIKRIFSAEQMAAATVPAATVTVPDLAGKTREEADQLLGSAGLQLGTLTSVPRPGDTAQHGKIVGQSPAANASVARDSRVNCQIATP
jgi:hypothetical protein